MAMELLEQKTKDIEIIKTNNWNLPINSLGDWRPFSATLSYEVFIGPHVGHGHGINLNKNMVAYACGARGSAKTLSMSYWLAKIMRSGRPVWTNYPISFYVSELGDITGNESKEFIPLGPCQWRNLDNTMSYYESMILDLDKFYTFDQEIRNGAVGIDELQYFVEARTSGRYQNRVMGYQLMQIRKTANSFYYTVQNPHWVDGRFGWSADYECKCQDVSKKSYDRRSIDHEIEEGEYSRWLFHDISGVLTGEPYQETGRDIGPFQFKGKEFWDIYPTHFIIDIFEAMEGPQRDKEKKDKETQLVQAITDVINESIAEKIYKISAPNLWKAIAEKGIEVNSITAGKVLSSIGITHKQNGKHVEVYDFSGIANIETE
jgi:hypothetical protein